MVSWGFSGSPTGAGHARHALHADANLALRPLSTGAVAGVEPAGGHCGLSTGIVVSPDGEPSEAGAVASARLAALPLAAKRFLWDTSGHGRRRCESATISSRRLAQSPDDQLRDRAGPATAVRTAGD